MRGRVGRWIALSRPRLAPAVVALPLLGWAFTLWDRALPPIATAALPGLVMAWWLVHAGTMWLNAARDRDEGEVLLGRSVPVPPGTAWLGLGALIAAVGVAGWTASALVPWTVAAALLAVAYSAPWGAWKSHPVLGPLVNVVGYGVVSPGAGHALVGLPPTPRSIAMLGVVALGVWAAVYVAQAFQEDEDRARGDRTLVARHGAGAAIQAARAAFAGACGLGMSLVLAGWLPALCGVAAVGWLAVDRHLATLVRLPQAGGAAAAVETGRRVLLVVVLGIGAAGVQYRMDLDRGGEVAGLATRAGRPVVDPAWIEVLARSLADRRRAMTEPVR